MSGTLTAKDPHSGACTKTGVHKCEVVEVSHYEPQDYVVERLVCNCFVVVSFSVVLLVNRLHHVLHVKRNACKLFKLFKQTILFVSVLQCCQKATTSMYSELFVLFGPSVHSQQGQHVTSSLAGREREESEKAHKF